MTRPDPGSRDNGVSHGVRAQLRRAFARLSRFVTAAIQKLFRVTPSSPTTPGPPSPALPGTGHSFSDADVLNTVKMWNNHAKQVAPNVADDFSRDFTFVNVVHPTQEQTSAAQRISEYTDPGLVRSLRKGKPEDIVVWLRPAFEACLAFAVHKTASPMATEGSSASVKSMHERLQEARSIIIEGVSDILLVAGCTATLPTVKSQVIAQFEGLHASLFESPTGPLNRVLHYATSSDCEMFIARPHEEFQPEGMGVDDDERQQGRVVCTTSVGLIRWVPSGSGRKRVVVLKALVLLESFLD